MLEKETRKAQDKIQKVLQGFFDKTGRLPASIDFVSLDISTTEDRGVGRRAIMVADVYLKDCKLKNISIF